MTSPNNFIIAEYSAVQCSAVQYGNYSTASMANGQHGGRRRTCAASTLSRIPLINADLICGTLRGAVQYVLWCTVLNGGRRDIQVDRGRRSLLLARAAVLKTTAR